MKNRNFLLAFLFIFLIACQSENPGLSGDHVVNVHLAKDPQRINPILHSTSTAREVYQYIFVPLAEYNPASLVFEPILIKNLPESQEIKEGTYVGGVSYTFELLDEAKWEDGTDITASDYLFTLKMIMHPRVNAARWRSVLNKISDIQLDESDKKKFTVFFEEDYMLSLEACASVELFPEHIYDAHLSLRNVDFTNLVSDQAEHIIEQDSSLINFAKDVNSSRYSRDVVAGAGPYKLTEWESDQYLVLERKTDWWGNNFADTPYLYAYPQKIIMHIIADEAAAITQLKNGGLDILKGISASNFNDLKEDANVSSQFNFSNPQLMRYYYLGLNNRMPLLDENNERKALAHLLPIAQAIESLEEGMGTQIVGDFLPTRSYYDKSLKPIGYDLEKAKEYLEAAGWEDTDGDGIRDKKLNGKKTDYRLRIHVSGSKLGNNLALILQESAAPAGVDIEIVQKKFSLIRSENLATGDFEIVALVKTQSLTPNDPYLSWHTDNAIPGGSNYFGYGSEKTDDLIEQIRTVKDEAQRSIFYLELQEIMYQEQPVIFLYAPQEKILSSNKFTGIISTRRPGYFANSFKRQDS